MLRNSSEKPFLLWKFTQVEWASSLCSGGGSLGFLSPPPTCGKTNMEIENYDFQKGISSSKVQLSGYFAWIWNIGPRSKFIADTQPWWCGRGGLGSFGQLCWDVPAGFPWKIILTVHDVDGPVYLNLEYAYMNLSLSLYIYIVGAKKCFEPRIIYIYIYLCMNTCLHTHEMQMYLYDVKFGSITAYISPPVLHTNCFIASSAQIWGGFFRSPEANEQPGVSRSSTGHTFHFPRDGGYFSGWMDDRRWEKVGLEDSWIQVMWKKTTRFPRVFATNILSVFGIGIIHVSTYVQHELNVIKMYANSQEKRLIDMAPWMAP